MNLTTLRVQNYKGLKDITIPLSRFGCLIGENNAGKSSVLQALLLLLPGPSKQSVTADDFYDLSLPIRIELKVEDITDEDLQRIANDEHRASFMADIDDHSVTFVRVIHNGEARTSLQVSKLGPKDANLTNDVLNVIMKGKGGRDLRAAVVEVAPILDAHLAASPTQAAVRSARDIVVAGLPDEDKQLRDKPLATGLDAGIKNFLPEPIYIEAVKDAANEVKTTDTATFGKLLGILLDEVKDKFDDIEQEFQKIQKQLSRVTGASGEEIDARLPQVQTIESIINNFVKESFPEVDLKISVPVPKMKTILSSAEIAIDDGHEGSIQSKGDGLKRAVAFAILRAYTKIRESGINPDASKVVSTHYWLLFEEPELYLYPRAQRQLFSALRLFSIDHPVLVTTHSPLFFDASATQSFTKFKKMKDEQGAAPYSEVFPIELDDIAVKTAFQIICHENNNIGFFAKKVVLVEGDSDGIFYQHISKLLNEGWDAVERNVAFTRINGKGNISAYRSFFNKFNIPVHVICDLDTLVSGFSHLDASDKARELHAELMSDVSAYIAGQEQSVINNKKAIQLVESRNARWHWEQAELAADKYGRSEATFEEVRVAVDDFFNFKRKDDRLAALKTEDGDIFEKKEKLLEMLSSERNHILSLGTIEDYYSPRSVHSDKVRQVMEYCDGCDSKESLISDLNSQSGRAIAELERIMQEIFDDADAMISKKEIPIDASPVVA